MKHVINNMEVSERINDTNIKVSCLKPKYSNTMKHCTSMKNNVKIIIQNLEDMWKYILEEMSIPVKH